MRQDVIKAIQPIRTPCVLVEVQLELCISSLTVSHSVVVVVLALVFPQAAVLLSNGVEPVVGVAGASLIDILGEVGVVVHEVLVRNGAVATGPVRTALARQGESLQASTHVDASHTSVRFAREWH